ncbi:MAG: hypothetical protein ABIJ47_13250 [Candidatus Bathyarchaeota archaeon]
MFEEGKKLAKKAMTSGSKDDVIAEKIFDLLSSRGYSSKKGLTGRGGGDYHYRRFDPPQEGKAVEVKVSRRGAPSTQSGDIIGTLSNISKTLGPQRVKIEFALVEKEGGFLGIGKGAKRFEFSMNADDYIDNELRVKDEAAFTRVLNGYLKTLGLPE